MRREQQKVEEREGRNRAETKLQVERARILMLIAEEMHGVLPFF